jgi:hypothetical protein
MGKSLRSGDEIRIARKVTFSWETFRLSVYLSNLIQPLTMLGDTTDFLHANQL